MSEFLFSTNFPMPCRITRDESGKIKVFVKRGNSCFELARAADLVLLTMNKRFTQTLNEAQSTQPETKSNSR